MTTVLPLIKDKIALTSGTVTFGTNKIIHCDADGTIDINWIDGTSTTGVTLVTGDDRSVPGGVSVEIQAGTFTIA